MNGKELLSDMSYVHSKYVQEAEDILYAAQNNHSGVRRAGRVLLVAAILSAMLATTVFAYVGFTQYENPMEMLRTFFGTDEYSKDDGKIRVETYYDLEYEIIEPTVEHVPVDQEVAQEVAPYISAVGQSICYDDYVLTVNAHQYDSATNCGVIYYTIENEHGVKGYDTQFWGEVWWPGGELVNIKGAQWMNYIVEEETTDTILSIASYYCNADIESKQVEIMFFFEEEQSLKLPLLDGGGMTSKRHQDAISVSPIAIKLHLPHFKFLGYTFEGGAYMPPVDDVNLEYLALRFIDGSEYIIKSEADDRVINNTKYALINENCDASYVFNRLVDMESVKSVIVNETEYELN